MDKRKRSFGEVLIAQWPGVAGLLFIVSGLMVIYDTKLHPSHRFDIRVVAILMAIGVAFIGYWALAHRSDDYNF
jgi:hypothetical protein